MVVGTPKPKSETHVKPQKKRQQRRPTGFWRGTTEVNMGDKGREVASSRWMKGFQSDIAKRASTVSREARNCAMAIALPNTNATPRISLPLAAPKTVVGSAHKTITLTNITDTEVGTSRMIPKGNTFFAISRSPLQNHIYYKINHTAVTIGYRAYFAIPDAAHVLAPSVWDKAVDSTAYTNPAVAFTSEMPLNPMHWENFGEEDIYGQKYYSVDAGNRKGIFLRSADAVTVHVELKAATIGGTIFDNYVSNTVVNTYQWSGTQWDPITFFDFSIVTAGARALGQLTINGLRKPGYYAFGLQCREPSQSSLMFGLGVSMWYSDDGVGEVFCIRPAPYFVENEDNVDSYYSIGSSILLTNTSMASVRNGVIAGFQLPADASWDDVILDNLNDSVYDRITSKCRDAFTSDAERGIYGFHIPNDLSCLDNQKPVTISDNEITGIYNPLLPIGGWLVVGVATTSVQTLDTLSPYAGCAFEAIVSTSFCFGTMNPWLNMLPPSVGDKDWDVAVHILGTLRTDGQFTHNPNHLSSIGNFLKKSLRGVAALGPEIAALFSAIMPNYAIPASIVGNAAKALASA